MRSLRRGFGSTQTWFALATVATFVYAVESWRRGASRKATRGEQARFRAAVVCLLGDDGPRLAYSPGEARRRLRMLAMSTPVEPSTTWLDRCVPLLRDLAVHGAEVDVTRDPRAAPTAVARHARELALLTARVGLVWEVRSGLPDVDLEHVADALVRTATEIDLAAADASRGAVAGPRAPLPVVAPAMAAAPVGALLPLPVGSPRRFLAGAPTPFLSTVTVGPGGVAVEPLANDDARWWRVSGAGVVRIVPEEGARDGLSPVRLDTAERAATARIAAPPRDYDPRAVSLDAAVKGGALWLAEAVRGRSPVLARLPLEGARGSATAARLAHGPRPEESARIDEEVAVLAEERGVVAAYTEHVAAAGVVDVRLVRAGDGERAAVHEVAFEAAPWQLRGRRPGVALCVAQGRTWVFAAAADEWRAGMLRGRAVIDAGRVTRAGGRGFDEGITVRCGPQGALAYGRDRPRASPLWRCLAPADDATPPRCDALPIPQAPQPRQLDPWTTTTPAGERRAHPEWPLVFASTRDGAVLALRAAGSIAALARWAPGARAWSAERVVFDAALDEPGRVVLGAELYADGARVTMALSTATDLRVAASEDDGVTWRAP